MPTSKSNNKTIGITLGDPAGIGPEIIAKALKDYSHHSQISFVLIAHKDFYPRINQKISPNLSFLEPDVPIGKITVGKPTKTSGQMSLAYLNTVVDLLKTKQVSALVTAPLCKEAICLSDPKFIGHTEFLADKFGINNVGMMFVAPKMRTIIVTRHLPLKSVSENLTEKNIIQTIELVEESLRKNFHIKKPKIFVCGLNPHAGENGLMGDEEQKIIIPAIKKLIKKGIHVQGPFAADTLFSIDLKRQSDCIVAMYHDQGLIPIKTLYLNQLVNLTIGLPFIRTSPAHGTAFDIAGQNKADHHSMSEAIKLAIELS